MKNLVVLLLLATLLPGVAFAQEQAKIDPQKEILIKEMLELTGSINLGRQMMARMVEIEKQGKSTEEQKKIDLFASRMDPEELIDEVVLIYDRHFTKQELSEILQFYKSETGMKLLKEMPALLQEGMDMGAKWSRQKAIELQQELEIGTSLQ